MKIKHTYSSLFLFLLFFFSVASVRGDNAESKPNVVVFLVDDLGWNDTSLALSGEKTKYNKRYQTPNLETLASQGMTFTHARSNAICVPSRASLLSGQNFMRHQVKGDLHAMYNKDKTIEYPGGLALTSPENMLPAVLKKEGYFTIHSGKYHICHRCPADKSPSPEEGGFDVNIAGTGYGAPASYYAKENFQRSDRKQPMPGLESYNGKDMHLTEVLTIEALKSAKQAVDQKKPFFLYLAHHAVHTPIQEQKEFRDHYNLEEGEPEAEAKYATMIEGVDQSLGQVLSALEEWGIDDNTLVIFYSDNGGRVLGRGKQSLYSDFQFNYPLRSGKASAYEGGNRVPCVVRWPGKAIADVRSKAPVTIEDIYTTVLDACSAKAEKNYPIDGMSWLPLFQSKYVSSEFKKRSLYFYMPYRFDGVEFNGPEFANGGVSPSASLIKREWKLLYFFTTNKFELYNLNEDAGEKNNIVDSYPGLADRLVKELDANMHKMNLTTVPLLLPARAEASWPMEAWQERKNATCTYEE